MIKKLIESVKDKISGKTPDGSKRSSHWPSVRKHHLEQFPVCEVCGGSDDLEVHHVKPFHLHPDLELEDSNLITLCESKKNGVNCHLFVGHLGSFKSFNESVKEDAKKWNIKLKDKP